MLNLYIWHSDSLSCIHISERVIEEKEKNSSLQYILQQS